MRVFDQGGWPSPDPNPFGRDRDEPELSTGNTILAAAVIAILVPILLYGIGLMSMVDELPK
jgi:hypothetical protein